MGPDLCKCFSTLFSRCLTYVTAGQAFLTVISKSPVFVAGFVALGIDILIGIAVGPPVVSYY